MATIYIPVEVPDEEVARYLGQASLAQIATPVPTQAAPQPQQAPQPDPWGGPATTGAPPAAQPQPAPTYSGGAVNSTPQGNPTCAHGEMRYVPAGFSRNSGKGYAAFWGCPAPRGTNQCKSVPA